MAWPSRLRRSRISRVSQTHQKPARAHVIPQKTTLRRTTHAPPIREIKQKSEFNRPPKGGRG
eukprot:4631649-Prymnesium_polylepis.2